MVRRSQQKPRIRNPTQTRAKLLQATVDLIADKGVEAVSLKEVVRVANVSRGVAYQHFKDREHLLRDAKTWISDRLAEAMLHLDAAPTEEHVHGIATLVLGNREASKLLVADALSGRDFPADHPLYKLLLQVLEEFKASGRARKDMDVEIMSFIMLGSVATLIMLSHLPKGADLDDLARRFTAEWTRVLHEGIFAEGAERRTNRERASKAASSRPKPKVRRA
jgi:AcrR family transcriptional regulator